MNELKDILNNNLITWIRHDESCKNCKKFNIELATLDRSNCEFNITNYGNYHVVYNRTLNEMYGCFSISIFDKKIRKYNSNIIDKYEIIDEDTFIDSVKPGSVFSYHKSMECSDVMDRLTKKSYIQKFIVDMGNSNYYVIENSIQNRTKPAKY
jgi:hypothetical protein